MRPRTALLMQDPESQIVMSRAGDDVAFGLENRGVPTDEIWPAVRAALETVGWRYGPNRPTDQLSGGEQQRLALAGVLALEPDLLLLDEPTANLDPDGAQALRDALARILDARPLTLVLVEHRVAEWLPLVTRVVVMAEGGGILLDGPPAEVFVGHDELLTRHGIWTPDHAGRRPPRPVIAAAGRVTDRRRAAVGPPAARGAAALQPARRDGPCRRGAGRRRAERLGEVHPRPAARRPASPAGPAR